MFSLTLLLAAVAMEPWKDPTKSTVERVDNLISLLSLDEKVCIYFSEGVTAEVDYLNSDSSVTL